MEEASMSGTDDDLPPLGQPSLQNQTHHRRHLRYATPETSTPPPPHFILEAAMSSQHSRSVPPPNPHRNSRPTSASPPPPSVLASSGPNHHPGSQPPVLEVDGQDHDRMETDEESEESDSGAEADTPDAASSEGATAGVSEATEIMIPPAAGHDEDMDTSPDNPAANENPPTPAHTNIVTTAPTNEATGELTALRVVHVQMPPNDIDAAQILNAAIVGGTTHSPEEREARLLAAERELAALGSMRRAERVRAERNRHEGRQGREAEDHEDRDDEDSEDSEDEEEAPFWASLKEDTSAPDEHELKMIEDTIDEVTALNHEHWERKAFEPLDDPEYVPGEGHRISWTVVGVHGTPDKPNKAKFMRSPSVLIDGFYWNIKYYPHGNDGTEQLSIYIECSPTPYETAEAEAKKADTEEKKAATPAPALSADQGAIPVIDPEASASDNAPAPPAEEAAPSVSVNAAPSAHADDMEATPTSVKKLEPEEEEPWGIPAQISCVIYNPNEPRVNFSQKGCHRFYNDNPDWGWTRFHGPWDEIHKRQRYQRQALLRNDTLSMTAYIRTFKDDTKALWWHPPKDKAEWDCMTMTGVRSFDCHHQSTALIAAISSWLHLTPIVDLIRNMHVPDPIWEANLRMRPAYEYLQDILDGDTGAAFTEERELDLLPLLKTLNFYGADVDGKMDVVMIWETLRRILNFEASGLNTVAECKSSGNNMFNDVLVLKQPDPFGNDTNPSYQPQLRQIEAQESEAHSVQETIDLASHYKEKAFRMWRSFAGEEQNLVQNPAVLQIELHRQRFLKEARKWKKLTHRVELNETVVFNSYEYTLYGMIVHSGDLESKDYYSVIRPEGPGTRWLKYAGDNSHRKVEILTTKKAIYAHEGVGMSADGTAAVAYIALYVRTDRLSSVLCTPFKSKSLPQVVVEKSSGTITAGDGGLSDSKDNEEEMQEDMPVYVYGSELFNEHTGRGLCDPWVEQNRGNWVKEFKFPPKTTISEIKKTLIDKAPGHVRLWPMFTMVSGANAYPSLNFGNNAENSLEEIASQTGGCRFWMFSGGPDSTGATASPPAQPASEEQHARVAAEAAQRAALLAAIRAEAAVDRIIATGDDTEMAEAANTLQQEGLAATITHDRQSLQQSSGMLSSESSNTTPTRTTYFLVKLFDTESQSLRGMGSHVVKSEAKISEEVKKLLKVDSHESWDLWIEQGLHIRPKDQIKSNATFEGIFGGANGNIIIAQRHLTSAQ